MKPKSRIQKWWRLAAMSTWLAGSASVCLAVDTIIVNNFDSSGEIGAWTELTGAGTIDWLGSDGGGGCMKITVPAATGANQVQPQVALGAKSFNSAQYWSISFDIKVDPSSGLGSDGVTFGHWQVVPRNAGGSWNGLNWTELTTAYTAGWQHVELGFVQPYDTIESIVIQVQGGPWASDFIYYIDNIKINPLPLSIGINSFTNASEVAAYSAWGANGSGVSWAGSPDAGGATPAGSMQISANYDGTAGWSEATCQRDFSFDPSRFSYLDVDLYLDPGTTTTYGQASVFLRQNHAPWNWLWIGGHNFSAADVGKWTHLSMPMAPTGETNASGFVIQTGGNDMAGPLKIYADNIKIWRPETPPALVPQFPKGGSAGVTLTMDNNTDQWQRDAITTPSQTGAYTWYNAGGVTYSFTMNSFPDAVAHPGFGAHLYIVNEDTIPGTDPAWDETYGAADWNAADIMVAQVENIATGGVDFTLRYKTNLPGANLDHTAMTVHSDTALGTWTLGFGADNVSVTVTGPGGISTNLTIPQEVADRFNCSVSFLQFGASKNDGNNTGINNGTSMTFSRVQMTGGSYPFDDTFGGPGLTANNAWRTTRATAVNWSPDGVGLWLSWSTPDDGFTLQVASDVKGPYTDAGVTYTYIAGVNRVAAVPAVNVPKGNAFFRLVKPQ